MKKFSIVVDRIFTYRVDVEAESLAAALDKAASIAPGYGADCTECRLDSEDQAYVAAVAEQGFRDFIKKTPVACFSHTGRYFSEQSEAVKAYISKKEDG